MTTFQKIFKNGGHFEFSNFRQNCKKRKIYAISLTVTDRVISSKFSTSRVLTIFYFLSFCPLVVWDKRFGRNLLSPRYLKSIGEPFKNLQSKGSFLRNTLDWILWVDITHDNVFLLYAFHFFRTTIFTMRPISSFFFFLGLTDRKYVNLILFILQKIKNTHS